MSLITEGEAVRSRPGTSSAFIALFLLYCGWLIGPFAILRPFIWFCASFDAQLMGYACSMLVYCCKRPRFAAKLVCNPISADSKPTQAGLHTVSTGYPYCRGAGIYARSSSFDLGPCYPLAPENVFFGVPVVFLNTWRWRDSQDVPIVGTVNKSPRGLK